MSGSLLSPRQLPLCRYFADSAGLPPHTPPLEGDARADVVVVGGGYTGLAAALRLAEQGVDVRVLEAHFPGWGSSGRGWGQVAATAKFMPAQVEKDFPAAVAQRINDAAAKGPERVFALVRKHAMSCQIQESGILIAAHSRQKIAGLAATATDLQRRGYPVEMLGREDAVRMTGSLRYETALYDRRGGSLNPLGYAWGLARAAQAAGVRLNGQTPVVALARVDGKWRAQTPTGTVVAHMAILATGAFTDGRLHPGTAGEVMPVLAHEVISEPLDPEHLKTILPYRQPLNETRKLFIGYRILPDGRLQAGIDGPLFCLNKAPFLAAAHRHLKTIYPQLAGLRWAHCWSGWMDMTVDQYPRLHELAPGLVSGYGFSGRGVAIATLMGEDLAHLVLGYPRGETVHPVTPPRAFALHPVYRPLVRMLVNWYRLRERIGVGSIASPARPVPLDRR